MTDELDPISRLRAVDPALDVEASEGLVDRIVDSATAHERRDADTAVDLGAERARRRRKRILASTGVAASIVAALAIGGIAGYALVPEGRETAAEDAVNDEEGAAPPITLDGPRGGAEGAAPELGADTGLTTRSLNDFEYGYGGRNAFHAGALFSSAATTATGYAYDGPSSSNVETVSALAAALDVDGVPEIRDGSWVVGAEDGVSPSLSVYLDGTLSFFYYDPTFDPWACGDDCDPPTADAAVGALRDVLAEVGRDPDAFEYTSETWGGSSTHMAYAWPVIDGQRLDQPWILELAQEGVYSLQGGLSSVVPLGEYAVVSAQEAFERLSDPRFGAQMTALPYAEREEDAAVDWSPPTAAPELPPDGAALSWPVDDVELVSVRLGWASRWQSDGNVLVVPTYAFTDAGGGTWSVIAVAESRLDFAVE
ncbi:hypothetical protein N8K70_10450 [Microbacterium betulae]|uniref:Uncharacterized protein n=1 Tax=Microbacterium betulae TaxID=2981139 RepID=A0AA97FF05_9MICO|nr:hypothetical protein [Microbacterium sp. AB]WOF21805.1 hypothetical protein N8K70_10450 [Microbacterium sp. AB]